MTYQCEGYSSCSPRIIDPRLGLNSIQEGIIPILPIASEPVEPSYIETIRQHYTVPFETEKLMAAFPLINIIKSDFNQWCGDYSKFDPLFSSAVLGIKADSTRKPATFGDLIFHFSSLMHEFHKSDNSTNIAAFLKKMSQEIGKLSGSLLDDKLNKQADKVSKIVGAWSNLFQARRLDILKGSILSLCSEERQLDPSDDYRVAVRACLYLSRALGFLAEACTSQLESMQQINPLFEKTGSSSVTFLLSLRNQLAKEERLTVLQKKDLMIAFKLLFRSYAQDWNDFFASSIRCSEDLINNYIPIVGSTEVEQISGFTEEESFDVYNRKYVQQYIEIYKGFIPRVKELKDWLTNSSGKLMEKTLLIQYFYLYMSLGDLISLKKRLDTEVKNDSRQATLILFEEINSFANKCKDKDNRCLQIEIVEILLDKTLEFHTLIYRTFNQMYSIFSSIHLSVHTILDDPLIFAKKVSSHLFDLPPAPFLASISSSVCKQSVASENNKGKIPSLPSADQDCKALRESSESSAGPSTLVPQLSQPVLYEDELQILKVGMLEISSQLQEQPKGFGMKEALGNMEVHWCNMLCIWKRLIDRKESVSDQELAAFILDIVREGSLSVEQSLAALDRSSNGIKGQLELADHMTHNLVNLLFSCSFHNGALSSQTRKSIHKLNHGEILLRDLRACSINGTDVEKLLTKARLLIEVKGVFERNSIYSHLIQYLNRVGMICLELQKHIGSYCIRKPKQKHFIEKLQTLQANFKKTSNTLETALVESEKANSTLSTKQVKMASPILEKLEEIGHSITTLKKQVSSLEIVNNLNDLHNNLFLQLRQEMEFHSSLQLIDGHLHLSKVCLLNQLIAERFLLNFLDALDIDYNLATIDHDLTELVQALGMKEKDFSREQWNFLSKGKAVRFLTRYPISHSAVQVDRKSNRPQSPMEKLIHEAIHMSRGEVFAKENQLENGYILGKRKLNNQITKIKEIVEGNLALLSDILQKVMQKKADMLEVDLTLYRM
jgi:hypothetical protein